MEVRVGEGVTVVARGRFQWAYAPGMTRKGWVGLVLLTSIIVLVIAWEATTTRASGWPHDPWLFVPAVLSVVFCGAFLLFAPKFENTAAAQAKQKRAETETPPTAP
jgi:hypothetical protein